MAEIQKAKQVKVIALTIFLCITGLSAVRGRDWGKVTSVYDGDTIQVRLDTGESEKVRLIGIDTPEMGDEREMVRFQAETAKRFTYYTIYGEKIRLTYDWDKRDEYGRLLAYVWLPDGMFNEMILRRGYASPLLHFPFKKEYMDRFKNAAEDARRSNRGLWKEHPYPPIDSREAGSFLGRMFAVEFRCNDILRRRNYILLTSKTGEFAAFIYREDLKEFPDLRSLKNHTLRVSGMIEDYRGRPQMVLFFPFQLEVTHKP